MIKTYIIGSTTPDTTSVRDFVSLDTRSREIGHKSGHTDYDPVQLTVVREYASSNGIEYFISIEDQMGYLYGFARLCCPTEEGIATYPGLSSGDGGVAMIRELHVYGQLATLASNIIKESKNGSIEKDASGTLESFDAGIDNVQHTGIGRQLMSLAEQIAHKKGYHTLSVISGVGVRGYYAKLGYYLEGTYMVKSIEDKDNKNNRIK